MKHFRKHLKEGINNVCAEAIREAFSLIRNWIILGCTQASFPFFVYDLDRKGKDMRNVWKPLKGGYVFYTDNWD